RTCRTLFLPALSALALAGAILAPMFMSEKKLAAWAQEGLITPDQVSAIRAFEQDRKVGKTWILYGMAAIGVSAIGIGIVSIVAANWDLIPPRLKLGSYIFWQILLGIALFRQLPKPG